MTEKEFVESLFNAYNSKIFISYHNVLARKTPDFVFEGSINTINYAFGLEVKIANLHNTHNYDKQLFGEILMNFKNMSSLKISSNRTIECSILLSYDNEKTDEVYGFIKNHIDNSKWNDFGKTYNIKHVFLYDSNSKKLYWNEWKDFLVSLDPTLY